MTPAFSPPDPPSSGSPRSRADALVRWAQSEDLVYPDEGRDLSSAVGLTYDISKLSGSAGLILAMHLSQAYSLAWAADRQPSLSSALASLATSQGMIASVISEPRTRGDILDGDAKVTLIKARVRITKRTLNTSYVPQAAAFLVSGTDDKGDQRLALANAEETDATPLGTTQMIGMGGIDNRPWSFTFDLPRAQLFDADLARVSRAAMTPATYILWAACWSGITASALSKAETALRQSKASETSALTDLRARHARITDAVRGALQAQSEGDAGILDLARSVLMNRLKIFASEEAVRIVVAAQALIGFRGYLRDDPLSVEVELRDILSAPLMVSNARLRAQTARLECYVDPRP